MQSCLCMFSYLIRIPTSLLLAIKHILLAKLLVVTIEHRTHPENVTSFNTVNLFRAHKHKLFHVIFRYWITQVRKIDPAEWQEHAKRPKSTCGPGHVALQTSNDLPGPYRPDSAGIRLGVARLVLAYCGTFTGVYIHVLTHVTVRDKSRAMASAE